MQGRPLLKVAIGFAMAVALIVLIAMTGDRAQPRPSVAESAGVEQVSVQQDQAASALEVTAGNMRNRVRRGVERHLESAAAANQRGTRVKTFARYLTQAMRTVCGGLCSAAGQFLRSVGAPPELAMVLVRMNVVRIVGPGAVVPEEPERPSVGEAAQRRSVLSVGQASRTREDAIDVLAAVGAAA